MNRTTKYRFGVLTSFLGCLGMLWLGAASADEGAFPESSVGSEARAPAPRVVLDRWGDIQGRLVTRAGSQSGIDSLAPANVDFIGLEHAVIFARHVTRVHQSYLPREASQLPAAVLELGPNGIKPHVLPLLVGQPLVLRNNDSRPHVFLVRPPLERETNLLIGPSQEQTVVFQRPHAAPLTVTCSLHEDQPAYVFATTHPYVAVSDANGEFVLHDLPAHEPIELCVWHERARRRHGEVLTSPEWTAGRRMVVAPPGAMLDLGESLIETMSPGVKRR